MKLILDLDATLIDSFYEEPLYTNIVIKERPHLKQFLEFVFENCESVSIWTAASESWWKKCYSEIIYKYIPIDKCFDFVITYEDGLIASDWNGRARGHPKLLTKIYNIYPEYNYNNTFILDDNPKTYKFNSDNGIPIVPYSYYADDDENGNSVIKNDNELLKIINYIKYMLPLL